MIRASLALALALSACGGSVDCGLDTAPADPAHTHDYAMCDPAKALDAYRIAHGQVGAPGNWTVLADCTVCETGLDQSERPAECAGLP